MRVSVGDRFGPYEIVRPISSGGMGEVYLARDTRLDRDVALKILPAELADNWDHQRRFLQEARAAGALNHPNILAIYDVGTENGDEPAFAIGIRTSHGQPAFRAPAIARVDRRLTCDTMHS